MIYYVLTCFPLAVRFAGVAVDMTTAAAATSVSCYVYNVRGKGCGNHGNARLQTPHLVDGERRIHTTYVSNSRSNARFKDTCACAWRVQVLILTQC